ncbi:MAG: GNAT family N-acetyltransferase [Bacteroidota bacterium]|nr:GNAT family N-acetyltransferase [Bacteroidota bacterium]
MIKVEKYEVVTPLMHEPPTQWTRSSLQGTEPAKKKARRWMRREALRSHNENTGKGWAVEIVNDAREFSLLAGEWNLLAQKFQSPLLSYEWFAACADAFCPPAKLLFVVLRLKGEMAAGAPLVLVRTDGVERLELLGTSLLREPSGYVYRDEESLQRLLAIITAMRKPMIVGRLPLDALESVIIKNELRFPSVVTLKEGSRAPSITITSSWEEFEKGISASRRSSLRRARRHAEEFGTVEFQIITPEPYNVDNHLEEIFRVEAAGWKERNGTSMRSIQELKRFFVLYARTAARSGILRTCYLRINGTVVAAQLGVEYAERFWTFKVGYDEAFAHCSPGTLLMHEAIRYAFVHRLKSFEFLGNDEPWIRVWTDNACACITYRMYPWTIDGVLALGQDMSLRLLRRFKAWRKRLDARSAKYHA